MSYICLSQALPGIIGVGVTVELVGGFKIQRPFLKFLQERLLLLHHGELQVHEID